MDAGHDQYGNWRIKVLRFYFADASHARAAHWAFQTFRQETAKMKPRLATIKHPNGTYCADPKRPKKRWKIQITFPAYTRMQAMKVRLLELERAKIAAMDPHRLELMNLLADHGHTLDEDTVTALLVWKRQSS